MPPVCRVDGHRCGSITGFKQVFGLHANNPSKKRLINHENNVEGCV